ncbi:MAG: hypothetical protein M3Q42_08925 [Pseudomonadota bacterium]|nr:hypothetical protein [Pseudomonadota bacterium]
MKSITTKMRTPAARFSARCFPAATPLRGATCIVAAAALAALATLSVLTLALIPAAQAGTGIQRCIGNDGTPIYTDKPCRLLNAKRAPISGELLSRIARAQGSDSSGTGDMKGTTSATSTIARRSAASGCARSATQLTMDLQGSWALGDVNRLAESYHWAGIGHRRGQQIMRQLERLATQRLVQAEYFDATIGVGNLQLADASGIGGGAAGVLQLTLSGPGELGMQDFDVERYRGCYFIRF